MTVRVLVLVSCALLLAVPAGCAVLANADFERADPGGRPADWSVHERLDRNGYGPPDYRYTFDEVTPLTIGGGRGGSRCCGFPADGTWHGSISDHSRPNGDEKVSGNAFGKAAISQTVTLEPGTYVFGAYLRTADGDAYTAAFSLGYNLGEPAEYRNDSSTGIRWTAHDLGLKTSFSGAGALRERGEWMRYATEPFTLPSRGKVTVWIRFNFANNNSMRTRWQIDDAFIEPAVPTTHEQAPSVKARIGSPIVYPPSGVTIADCGDDGDALLREERGSVLLEKIPTRLFQHARAVKGDGFFTYEFSVPRETTQVYVAFEHIGPCEVRFGGSITRTDKDAPAGLLQSKQYMLTDRSLWRSGKLSVRFGTPDPAKQLAVLWVECGPTTRFRERLMNVAWDTVGVPWQVGLWDGMDHEFRGRDTDFVAGKTDASVLGKQSFRIHWNQSPRPGHRYWILLGHINPHRGGGAARAQIDVGADGLAEYIGDTEGESILDFDVTDYLKEGRNVVAVSAEVIDFVALVDTVPGIVDNRRLRLYFAGNQTAEDLTRVLHNSLYWLLDLHYDETGFTDASVPHGKWWQQYWPIDTAMALRTLLHYGFLDQAEQAAAPAARSGWQGHSTNRSGGWDNNGGNIIAIEICGILRRRGYAPTTVEALWPSVRSYCDKLCDEVAESPFGLIRGTNWENAGNREQGPCRALTTNLTAAALLLKASEAVAGGRLEGGADRWRACAEEIRRQVLDRLVFREDVKSPTGWVFPKDTWAYGLLEDGSYMLQPLAGYLWAGRLGTSVFGFIDPDTEIRNLYERTVEAALPLVGGPNDVVSGYASSYDGEETMFGCAALSDRTDWMGRLTDRFKVSTDYVKDVGSTIAEISRWAVGPPGWAEDTNLVCVAEYLDWPRYVLGIDDILYKGRQLTLIPRLPDGWNECGVNDWPVTYLDGGATRSTVLSYSYKLEARSASLSLQTRDRVNGLRVRVGPFDIRARSPRASVNGRPIQCRIETSGGRTWVWVSLDSGPASQSVEVTCEHIADVEADPER